MKAALVKKTEDYILTLLTKPELTHDEYLVLDAKLKEIRAQVEAAARQLEMQDTERKMHHILSLLMAGAGDAGGDYHV